MKIEKQERQFARFPDVITDEKLLYKIQKLLSRKELGQELWFGFKSIVAERYLKSMDIGKLYGHFL